ncbi:FAD/NAD(P)-binding protein [Nostoc ellipsosporum NOK]|nr:FAD/NAD(P)-binding protein [Nostoc ellipsosporum NOK]
MHIAILGGGPSGMFMFKQLVEANGGFDKITIFERKDKLGAGMPYSVEGAGKEHITNVSSNEIPTIVSPITDWLKTVPGHELAAYGIDAGNFSEYKVLPRLLFGQYLTSQFDALRRIASEKKIAYEIRYNSEVTDIIDDRNNGKTTVEINHDTRFPFDKVVVCTGHIWPRKHEGIIPGYFDSPYPPAKLQLKLNHPVAIKGSSLTAVDAIRTLARSNGTFTRDINNKITFKPFDTASGFKIVLHTRNGMLPAVRFHLENSHLSNDLLLTRREINTHIKENDGFLSLDYIFEQDFKLPIKVKHPEFYEQIAHMNLEEFVAAMMDLRERLDPFQLLKSEYAQAEKSIERKESIYWKEMLGVLSFALNYPAKHLSAEDMQRLQRSLLPLISIVIAYLPQGSAEELMAIHDAGLLELVSVGDDSEIIPAAEGGIIYQYRDESGVENTHRFATFVDCVGQPHLRYEDIPFKSLLANKTISPGKIKFKSADAARQALAEGKEVTETANENYYLKVSGIAINDAFQVLDEYGAVNERIYMMAVPYIGGYNPDYSGLDFGEAASAAIIKSLLPNQHAYQKD